MSKQSRSDAQMTDGAALVSLKQGYTDGVVIEGKGSFIVDVMTTLVAAKQRLIDGETPEAEDVASLFSLLRRIVDDVEGIERDLLRCLKWDGESVYTWQEIADMSGGSYVGRQGAQLRWRRLTDESRRTASRDMRRGHAVPRGSGTGVVHDSLTQAASRVDGETVEG